MSRSAIVETRSVLEIIEDVAGSLNPRRTATAVVKGLSVLVPSDHASVAVICPDGRLVVERRRPSHEANRDRVDPTIGEGLFGGVLSKGRPISLAKIGKDTATSDLLDKTRSAISVPIFGGAGTLIGGLLVESDQTNSFDDQSIETARQFAASVAPSIERGLLYAQLVDERRLEGEMVVARKVMRGILPRREPKLSGLDLAAAIEPYHEVGGDYYDFIPLGNDRWGLAIADVTGKGLPAALMVAAMRASLYSHAKNELALRAIFQRTNEFLFESAGVNAKYVTLVYAVLDIQARRLIYINAGHLPPVVLRASGEVELLRSGGFPLGMFDNPRYFERFLELESGDLVALYTDGITEVANAQDEEYGRDRLVSKLAEARDESASRICDAVLKDVHRFSGSVRSDDATLLIIKAT